jgi:thiosulfate reductase cytochrome b subunit
VTEQVAVRRGLPRTVGGEPWPPAMTATVRRAVPAVAPPAPAPSAVDTAPAAVAPAAATAAAATAAAVPAPAPAASSSSAQAPATATATTTTVEAPRVLHGRTAGAWSWLVARWGAVVVTAAGLIILAARGVTTLPGVPEFLTRYPGTYALPETAPIGFPLWANWMHYLNFFFMMLILRTGLQVRHERKPAAYWTPAKGGTKISLAAWLHTAVDVLWLANGIAFGILLFATGQWVRIVPTSWEVFPNAASALLQYLTMDWPAEQGWVAFNSLQQLMYFVVVFVAAPVAALTGVRMSRWWPQNATRLNRLYPAPLARALHFPTMLFFVLFVIVHVFLVFATGARRNLNHMFGASDALTWGGFGWFALGLAVVVATVAAARPLVVAPVASLFGRVSSR